MLKIGGAILVIVGCSGFGILLSYHTKNETHALKYLISALDFIDCELSFRLTPLSQAFLRASEISVGCIQSFLISAAQEMEHCSQTDAAHCIGTALDNCNNIPPVTRTRISRCFSGWMRASSSSSTLTMDRLTIGSRRLTHPSNSAEMTGA